MRAQEGHEDEVKAQGEQEEEANSVHEESHVSNNRHMTWWQECLVGPSPQRASLADGERPPKSVASSRKSRAGGARDGKGRRERKRGMGEKEDGQKRKQHVAHCVAPTPAATAAAARSRCIQGGDQRALQFL